MKRFSYRKAIYLCGLIWFAVGLMLLYKGLHFVTDAAASFGRSPLLQSLRPMFGSYEQAALILICFGLFLGFIKRAVLAKTVKRTVGRITSYPEPIRFRQIYTKGYFILIAVMMSLGIIMRLVHLPLDIRGLIDVAVGSALMNGALIYFRSAEKLRRAKTG
ncbi:MAG: hypothetical protein Tsb0015_12040 [Simkaniaceae bacterium]